MVCDSNDSPRRFLKRDVFGSQNDPVFANLGNKQDIELSLSSIFNSKFITLIPINPQLAFINWQIDNKTIFSIKNDIGAPFDSCSLILRIYDITDTDFNGFNARTQFDLDIDSLSGCHYLTINQVECLLMAEVGFRCIDSRFFPCARSNTMFFQGLRDFSSGLYISHGFNRFYTIRRTFEPPSKQDFFAISSSLLKSKNFSVAVFLNEKAIDSNCDSEKSLSGQLRSILAHFHQSNIYAYLFTPASETCKSKKSPVDYAFETSMQSLENFYELHRKNPFNCVQSHNWYSAPAAMIAASANYLPLVSVFHSLELERKSEIPVSHSQLIESWERKSILQSDMVLVSREQTRKLVIEHYGKSEDRVAIIADQKDNSQSATLPFNLSAKNPIILFAGELNRHSGADLIIESLPNVCREFPSVQFVFIGDGQLKADLEHRASSLNVINNCLFTGHLESDLFNKLFNIAYALLLPFRHKCNNKLAQRAVSCGLSILTTHQAQIPGVNHGSNGLIVYDNPGSVCWGIKELLSKQIKSRNTPTESTEVYSIEYMAKLYSTIWTNLISSGKEVFSTNGCN